MVIFYFVQFSLSTGLYSVHPGQGHSQNFFKENGDKKGLGTKVPQRGLGAEPRWGSGAKSEKTFENIHVTEKIDENTQIMK